MKSRLLPAILACFGLLFSCNLVFAEKIAIVYTGNTSASLYACHCPAAPDGGIARRATKIKQLRKDYPNILLVDSGNFFASGLQDIDATTPEMDKKRTEIYFKGMEIMGYDAVNIGADEFNFGKDFLLDKVKQKKIKFLSCNLDLPKVQAYMIKKVGKIKIGIIGISPLGIKTAGGFEFKEDASEALKKIQANVSILKKKVDIIVLLSQLGKDLDKQVAEQVAGIDIIISNETDMSLPQKLNSAIYLTPFQWGRTLGLLELDVENGVITNSVKKNIPMSKDIADDEEINSFLPACFRDPECYKPGFIGKCKDAGEKNAACVYEPIAKVNLTIIVPKICKTCNIQSTLDMIGTRFPVGEVNYLDSESPRAKEIIAKLDVNMLPIYIVSKEISKHPNYPYFSSSHTVVERDNYYFLNPFIVGVSYFLDRPVQNNRLDLFISLRDKIAKKTLEKTKDLIGRVGRKIDFNIHFLAAEDNKLGNFSAPFGDAEIAEDKQALCVMSIYPKKMWEYMFCHIDNLGKDSLSLCSKSLRLDANKIKKCIESEESVELLRENIGLVAELKVSYGPLFLLNNQEIFGVKEDTPVEELEKIVK
ncbi:MAG: hypothetical protein FJZ10_01900 [Candidatus Omnitrophica bacterium]|nr:hypothetical protein [Candidatus Omnitrophota bacterium]